MKVLMLSLDRTLFGGGSSGDVLERHKKYADLAGHLDIIVFAGPEYQNKSISDNLNLYPTHSNKFTHFRAAANLAEKLMTEKKYDLLITQEFAAPAGEKIKKEHNIPWIVSIHSMFFSHEWLKLNPINWYLLYRIKKALKKADAFRTTNEIIKQKLRDWGINKPVLVQHTPVDVSKFKVKNEKSKISDQKLKILYVGRLAPEKNIEMLIDVFKNLEGSIELQITGEGVEEKRLKDLAKGDERVKFLGAKSHNELTQIYQEADIFVLPSNTESFGKVLIEAGAAGCALIATKTSGAQGIIEDGKTGLLINIGATEQLQQALQKLIENSSLRNQLSQNAQKMAEQYDGEKAATNWVNFWKQTVDNANQRMDTNTTNNYK